MTREELTAQVKAVNNKNLCLELSTGVGKSKLSLEYINKYKPKNILVVVPKLVLIEEYSKECIKWKKKTLLSKMTFVTYVSLWKYAGQSFDFIVLEECQHLSERAIEAFEKINYKRCIALSATPGRRVKDYLHSLDFKFISVGLRKAIDNTILPDPQVYLLPLKLDNTKQCCVIFKNKAKQGVPAQMIEFKDRFKVPRGYKKPYKIKCTQAQYYEDMSSLIDWYKRKSMSSAIMKTMWLNKAGDRLKWLSDQKMPILKKLKEYLSEYRTLIFCNSIEQSEILGNSISSKTGLDNLDKFNNGEIDFISSVNILNEGCNIVDCKIGIFGNLNNSEIITKQRSGRLLRHKEPIIIIPYFKDTREEELLQKMLENYNSEYIHSIKSINEIKL